MKDPLTVKELCPRLVQQVKEEDLIEYYNLWHEED